MRNYYSSIQLSKLVAGLHVVKLSSFFKKNKYMYIYMPGQELALKCLTASELRASVVLVLHPDVIHDHDHDCTHYYAL